MNNVLTAAQIAEMNDPSRFAREEAAREATRREMAAVTRRRQERRMAWLRASMVPAGTILRAT